ncbi:MAG: RNA polymerase sigma factor, partial [Terriglobales bacterium]
AVAAVVAENAPALLRVARAWRVPDVDAEDLVQETFVTFLTSLDRFQGRSQTRTWLCGILHNKIRAYRRSRRYEPLADDTDGRCAPDLSEASEAGNAIRHCLARLPARQRWAFHLNQIETQPRDQTSFRLGVSRGHFAVLLHRAKQTLRDCLERMGWGRGKTTAKSPPA